MMICDVCGTKVGRLERGPPDLESLDACETCLQDLQRRQSAVEQRLAEMRRQMRAETITQWRRERCGRVAPAS